MLFVAARLVPSTVITTPAQKKLRTINPDAANRRFEATKPASNAAPPQLRKQAMTADLNGSERKCAARIPHAKAAANKANG